MLTCRVCPGPSRTFRNPLSCFGGSPTAAGSPALTWPVSAPAARPVLVTLSLTVTVPRLTWGVMVRWLSRKVVLECPKPNGNSVWMCSASYHR